PQRPTANPTDHELTEPTKIIAIPRRDGVTLSAAVFLPKKPRRYPTLLAASPYRFDNDYVPAYPMYLWRETGPIAWYVDQGYAFVHVDVRGSGRSGGDYRFLDKIEQRDLFDTIERLMAQRWSGVKISRHVRDYPPLRIVFLRIP